jgi:hypothetical protein
MKLVSILIGLYPKVPDRLGAAELGKSTLSVKDV